MCIQFQWPPYRTEKKQAAGLVLACYRIPSCPCRAAICSNWLMWHNLLDYHDSCTGERMQGRVLQVVLKYAMDMHLFT